MTSDNSSKVLYMLKSRGPLGTSTLARALGISSRTIEVFDQRGIADRFLAAGQTAQVTGFGLTRLDISDFPTCHNYGLALRQKHIERILAYWISELDVPTLWPRSHGIPTAPLAVLITEK